MNTLGNDQLAKTILGLNRQDSLRLLLSCIDLTTLEGNDTDAKVKALCDQARGFRQWGLPVVAAVCVYPTFARLVRGTLEGTGIRTACVAGAFPSGQLPLHLRIEEVEYAVGEGAQEIDMVISRGRFLQGDYDFIEEEITRIKAACGDAHLKVILETGELISEENIFKASMLAMQSGADFIKTSTGKIQPAATPEAVKVMLESIREFYQKTGKRIGIKPAGGITEPDQALVYANMVLSTLGYEWLNPDLFRIGASRLAKAIADQLV